MQNPTEIFSRSNCIVFYCLLSLLFFYFSCDNDLFSLFREGLTFVPFWPSIWIFFSFSLALWADCASLHKIIIRNVTNQTMFIFHIVINFSSIQQLSNKHKLIAIVMLKHEVMASSVLVDFFSFALQNIHTQSVILEPSKTLCSKFDSACRTL